MMISGAVTLTRQAAVTVTLPDNSGRRGPTEARIDTGFSGDLTLPKSAIERLGLRWLRRANDYTIGDASTRAFNVYAATIQWHDVIRYIAILESEIFPVVGVGLLWENNLSIDFVHGGSVTIAELPELDRNAC